MGFAWGPYGTPKGALRSPWGLPRTPMGPPWNSQGTCLETLWASQRPPRGHGPPRIPQRPPRTHPGTPRSLQDSSRNSRDRPGSPPSRSPLGLTWKKEGSSPWRVQRPGPALCQLYWKGVRIVDSPNWQTQQMHESSFFLFWKTRGVARGGSPSATALGSPREGPRQGGGSRGNGCTTPSSDRERGEGGRRR